MNFTAFAESRKSVRGFQDKAVPKDVIDDIINSAKWAPSSYNTQTWHIHAVAGEVLNKIREGNTKNTLAGKPHVRDFPYKEEYAGGHRQNQIDVAVHRQISTNQRRNQTQWCRRIKILNNKIV